MKEYQQGPWEVEGDQVYNELDVVWLDQDKNTYRIASVDTGYGQASVANAKLISAAPELLEALQTMFYNTVTKDRVIWDVARVAIEKATGKTIGKIE